MRTLIITGGQCDPEVYRKYIAPFPCDYIIAVDGGLIFAHEQDIPIDVIIGDLDTVSMELVEKYRELGIEIKSFSSNKDYTDTHLAIIYAIEKGADLITLIGALGSRFDHALANIHVLMEPLRKNITCEILDANNRIRAIQENQKFVINNRFGRYISLIPLTPKVEGVTTKGLKYPLINQSLHMGDSVGISNEIMEEGASVEVKKGILLVIESTD